MGGDCLPLSSASPHTSLSQRMTSYQTNWTVEAGFEADVFASWLSDRRFRIPSSLRRAQNPEHLPTLVFQSRSIDLGIGGVFGYLRLLLKTSFSPSLAPLFSTFSVFFCSQPLPITGPLKDVSESPGRSKILSKSPQLLKTSLLTFGKPFLIKSTFLSSCCSLSLCISPKPKAYCPQ